MELHLHLSVAFRGLDRKWGKPVDLETQGPSYPCLPAVIERSRTTFSSEEYLAGRRPRPTPYSRHVERRRKENVKRSDSFADISSSRIPSESDVSASSTADLNVSIEGLVENVDKRYVDVSMSSLEAEIERRKRKNIFLQLKDTAKSYIDKKCRKNIVKIR